MDAHLLDPADWVGTPLVALSEIDSLLRCQICKDYYTSAVLTNCAHTFCSVCIRRCLSVESRCPTCNTPEQESRLRRNGILQEVVDGFVNRRDELLQVAKREAKENHASKAQEPSSGGKKRKRQEQDGNVEDEPPSRRTRSHRNGDSQEQRRTPNGNAHGGSIVVDSDEESTIFASPGKKNSAASHTDVDDGLVACPSCGKRMKEEYVFAHLDNCTGGNEPPRPPRTHSIQQTRASPAPQRLPQLSYNLLKDTALKKKLEDLKIPSFGPRALLIRRHSEWLALWNANCDSNHPRSKQELLRELDAWERSQGGRSANAGANGEGIKGKEFEPEDYNRRHGGEFADLIAQAKASRLRKQEAQRQDSDKATEEPHASTGKVDGDLSRVESSTEPAANASTAEDPVYEKEAISRRGSTAPPATGPLKISQSLHEDAVLSPADATPAGSTPSSSAVAAPIPTLSHAVTAPEPRTQSPQSSRSNARAAAANAINARISRPITTQYSLSRSPASAKPAGGSPQRRPSISEASPVETPPPAMMMWSGSREARRNSGDGRRTLPMFHMPQEPIVDADFDMDSK